MQIFATTTIIIGIISLRSLVVGANEMKVLRSQWGRLRNNALLPFKPTRNMNIMVEEDFSEEHCMRSSPENVAQSVSEQATSPFMADGLFSFLWIAFQTYAAFDILRNVPAELILVIGQFLDSMDSRTARDLRVMSPKNKAPDRAPATNLWFRAYGWWEILSVVSFSFIDTISYWNAPSIPKEYALGTTIGAATICWAVILPGYRMGGFLGMYLARKIPSSLYSISLSLPFWLKLFLCSFGLTLPLWLN